MRTTLSPPSRSCQLPASFRVRDLGVRDPVVLLVTNRHRDRQTTRRSEQTGSSNWQHPNTMTLRDRYFLLLHVRRPHARSVCSPRHPRCQRLSERARTSIIEPSSNWPKIHAFSRISRTRTGVRQPRTSCSEARAAGLVVQKSSLGAANVATVRYRSLVRVISDLARGDPQQTEIPPSTI